MYMSKSKTKGARKREGKLTFVDGARCSKNELRVRKHIIYDVAESYINMANVNEQCLLRLYKSGFYLINK